MLEKQIEKQLVKIIKARGGMCLKLTCPSMDGMPDRLVLLPGGIMAFVELKAPSKKPRPLQIKRMKQLLALGFSCFAVDSMESVYKTINELGGDAK